MDITIINKNNPNTVPTNDRAFQYGDGFFTTIKVVDGEAQLLEEHVARLEQCSSRLFFDSINLTEIESKIKQVAQTQALAVVKVVQELTGVGLKDAKELVDGAPKTIKAAVSKDEAEGFKKSLEEAGAEVELK